MIGGGGRYDQAACRDVPRGGACEIESELLYLGCYDNRRGRGRPITLLVWLCVPPLCTWLCSWELALCPCARIESQGRHRLLCFALYTYHIICPEARGVGTECVGVARPGPHQHQATTPAAVASSPWLRVLELACSSEQTPDLQQARRVLLQNNTAVLLAKPATLSGDGGAV